MYRKRDELQMLVDSLTPDERKNFLSAIRGGTGKQEPAYLQLFKSMSTGKDIRLKEESRQSMVVARRSLYGALLRHLRMGYQQQNGPEMQNLMQDIAILYERNLPEQCLRLLSKASVMARRYEQFPVVMQLLEWESRLNALLDKPSRTAEAIAQEAQSVTDIQNNILELERAFHKIMEYKRVLGFAFGKARKIVEEEVLRLPVLASARNCLSEKARYFFHHTRAICYFMMMDNAAAYRESRNLVQLDPAIIPLHDFLNGLLFHSTSCICSGYFEETLACLEVAAKKLEREQFGEMNILALKVFYYCSNYEVECFLYMGRREELAGKLLEIEESLTRFANRIPTEMAQVITGALRNGYLALGNDEKVERYLRVMQEYDIRTTRNDIVNDVFIFRLVWFLHCGLYAVMPSAALSAFRHFSNALNSDNKYELELAVCRLLKKEHDYSNPQGVRIVLEGLRGLFSEHIGRLAPQQNFVEIYSCYALWLDSMLEGCSYMEKAEEWYQAFSEV